MRDPIDILEIPEVPDLVLNLARDVASRLPDPCEGSRGHLAMMQVRDFEYDLEYIRKDPRNVLLEMSGGTYYNLQDLIEDMEQFIWDYT